MTVVLYLLPLGLIFDLAGYTTPSLRLFLIYGLLALPICLRPSRQAGWLMSGLVLAMVVRAALPFPAVAEAALFLLAHQVIWSVTAPVPRALRTGVVAYAFVHFYLFASPLGYPIIEAMTGLANQTSEWITGNPFHLGWSWQNLGGLLLFLILSVFSWDGSRVAFLRTGSFVLVALLVNALAAMILIDQVDFGADFVWELKFRDPSGIKELGELAKGLVLLAYPAFLFLAYLLAYLALHYGKRSKGEGAASAPGWSALKDDWRPGRKPLIIGGTTLLLMLVVVPPTSWRRPDPPELVFLNRGVVSFTKPDYTRYGKSAGGMFGMLPEYSRLFGCKTSVVKEIPATLRPGQVLVVTNLDEPLDEATHQRIRDFVANGGALWVMGDHTFIKNGRNHINDLLEPWNISLRNDSAQFFPQGWFQCYRFRQGTPFASLRDDAENRPGILVGASLELGIPAEPFVLGRWGYSDWGLNDPAPEGNRGHLGDFEYQASERLGDLVLVAGQRSGKGRVLVFGDTSSFFNATLSRSFELLQANLSWLGESNVWSLAASKPGRLSAMVLLLCFCGLAFRWRNSASTVSALATAGIYSIACHGPGGLLDYDDSFAREHLAVIDFSHQPNASKHSSMDDGLHGVSINLLRYGLMPVTANEWDPTMIDRARYVVMNAPRKPVSGGERRDLTRFMERGGTVIVGCGYQNYATCRSLLEPLGLRVRNVPLGRFFDRPAFGQNVSFMSAWPIEVSNDKAEIVCSHEAGSLIVSVPVGDGQLVLIGDSEFLHNRNMEGHDNHDPANTAFLKNLFDHTSK